MEDYADMIFFPFVQILKKHLVLQFFCFLLYLYSITSVQNSRYPKRTVCRIQYAVYCTKNTEKSVISNLKNVVGKILADSYCNVPYIYVVTEEVSATNIAPFCCR